MAIDQGTTGTTVMLVSINTGEIIAKAKKEYKQIYPKPGLVEHDLNDIWDSFLYSLDACYKQSLLDKKDLKAIGITNQRETICFFKKNGMPLRNAIVWQDRRTEDYCKKLKDQGHAKNVQKITGLTLDPYFSGTKIQWALDNDSNVKTALERHDLLIGNIDTYLLYRLSNGISHKTDVTNASRTLLMNLKSCSWDKDMLKLLSVPVEILPKIEESFTNFGETKSLNVLPDGVKITCILGDQQAALFGQLGVNKGDAKCTYGTGAFLLRNTGEEIVYSNKGLLTTVAYKHKGKTIYALEGSSYIAGAAVQWMRDNIKAVSKSSDIESLASNVTALEQMEHLMFMPFFTGIGCPYWISNAKASIIGITRDSELKHLAFACLEGIALSINDIIKAFDDDANTKTSELRVDGGAAANNLLLNLQASSSNITIIRPKIIETTGYGAALGALVGLGHCSISDLSKLWELDKKISPDVKYKNYFEKKVPLWRQMIKRMYLD
jgi:glycerol kinase